MNDLIEVADQTLLESFTDTNGLAVILTDVAKLVEEFEHDMSTNESRDKTKSFAAKIPKFKTRIDNIGKELVSGWKTKSKKVDAVRKEARDKLDELKIVARQPLTDYEAEQIRIATEKLAVEAAEELRKEIESDHEFADLMDKQFDRDIADKLAREKEEARLTAEREELERVRREKEIREEAAEQARIEAEKEATKQAEKVEADKQGALDREQLLKDQAEQAELDKIAAEKQAEIDVENARLAEVKRQKDKQAQEQIDLEKREANKRHVNAVMKKAKLALMNIAGIDDAKATKSILAIKDGDIPAIFIKF